MYCGVERRQCVLRCGVEVVCIEGWSGGGVY